MIVEPKIYIDAQGIIDALKYDQFKKNPRPKGVSLKDAPYYESDFPHKQKHVEYCLKLLKASEHKELTLLTSSLSVAEVYHLGIKPPSELEKRILSSVLTSGKVIILIPDSFFIAEKARDLNWKYEIELTGADAIHIASALEAKCIEFITNDKGVLAQKDKIQKLGLKVINADSTAALPASYTQPLLDTQDFEEDDVLNESEFAESDIEFDSTETANLDGNLDN